MSAHILSTWSFLKSLTTTVADLAGCHTIHISAPVDESRLKSYVKDSVRDTKIFLKVPEDIRQNIAFDLPNMQKKKEKLTKDLEKLNKIVSNEVYKIKATPETRDQHSKKV